ncbi:hypothetical protein D3C72_1828900 [compost metagenome]
MTSGSWSVVRKGREISGVNSCQYDCCVYPTHTESFSVGCPWVSSPWATLVRTDSWMRFSVRR